MKKRERSYVTNTGLTMEELHASKTSWTAPSVFIATPTIVGQAKNLWAHISMSATPPHFHLKANKPNLPLKNSISTSRKLRQQKKKNSNRELQGTLHPYCDQNWNKRKRKTKFKKFKCAHCKIVFETDIDAIIEHIKAHQNDNIIKIARLKINNNFTDVYRPEQHYFCTATDRFHFQQDVEICKIIIPESFTRNGDSIFCRRCGIYSRIIYDDNGRQLDPKTVARRATEISTHEEKCKPGKVKKTEKKLKSK